MGLPRQPHTSHPSHVHAIYTRRGVAGISECGIQKRALQLVPSVCLCVCLCVLWFIFHHMWGLTYTAVQPHLQGPTNLLLTFQGEVLRLWTRAIFVACVQSLVCVPRRILMSLWSGGAETTVTQDDFYIRKCFLCMFLRLRYRQSHPF